MPTGRRATHACVCNPGGRGTSRPGASSDRAFTTLPDVMRTTLGYFSKTMKRGPFLVYNNGITALTLDYVLGKRSRGIYRIKLTGISIVNGAQTTGSIGSLSREPRENLIVPIRLVKTNNEKIVENIVRYNNSQNKIQASDFRSTDSIQTRLRQEFLAIPQAEYDGGRRGGARDAMRRRRNLLPSYTVGQALAAFHGDPVTAYDQKSEIWVKDGTYLKYFNENPVFAGVVQW